MARLVGVCMDHKWSAEQPNCKQASPRWTATLSHMICPWPAYIIRHGPFLAHLVFSNEKAWLWYLQSSKEDVYLHSELECWTLIIANSVHVEKIRRFGHSLRYWKSCYTIWQPRVEDFNCKGDFGELNLSRRTPGGTTLWKLSRALRADAPMHVNR